jgi:carboxylesterase
MEFSTQPPADAGAPFRVAGGNSDAVLLIHGFTSGPRSLRPWADALLEAGYTVSLPLLPGHGTTWQDLARTRHEQWERAVEEEFDVLQRAHRRVFVAGLSMGGALALHLGIHRAPAGIAVTNPGLSFVDRNARFARFLKYVLASVPAIANDIAMPGQDEGAYARTPVAAVHQLALLFRNTSRLLPRVTAPVLVFRSRTDRVVSDASIDALRAGITGTTAAGTAQLRVDYLERSYHVATLDYDADAIFAGSLAFFESIREQHDA